MKIEICQNCDRPIGKLEEAHVYKGMIVCPECDRILRKKPSAHKSGSVAEEEPATPNQIEYAKRLNIDIPKNATKWELSDLISETVEEKRIRDVQTIEKTSKSYKATMLIGLLVAFAGIPTICSGNTELGAFLGIIGIIVFIAGRMFAWWYHG